MISVAVVDDEYRERENLRRFFELAQKKIQEPITAELFSSGEQFLSMSGNRFDLICLDIDMSGKNGIETAREIRRNDPEVIIIFITNLAQMAIRGYEVRAFDFILKPVNYNAFYMKIRSAISIIRAKKEKYLVVPTAEGMERFSTGELIYAEVNGHYLYFHTIRGVFKQKGSMREVEEKLNGMSFKRCNNCYLVNLKYVDGVRKDDLLIAGEVLKISRPRKKEFLQALGTYMGGDVV